MCVCVFIGPHDVRIRMKSVGICASDVHYLKVLSTSNFLYCKFTKGCIESSVYLIFYCCYDKKLVVLYHHLCYKKLLIIGGSQSCLTL